MIHHMIIGKLLSNKYYNHQYNIMERLKIKLNN